MIINKVFSKSFSNVAVNDLYFTITKTDDTESSGTSTATGPSAVTFSFTPAEYGPIYIDMGNAEISYYAGIEIVTFSNIFQLAGLVENSQNKMALMEIYNYFWEVPAYDFNSLTKIKKVQLEGYVAILLRGLNTMGLLSGTTKGSLKKYTADLYEAQYYESKSAVYFGEAEYYYRFFSSLNALFGITNTPSDIMTVTSWRQIEQGTNPNAGPNGSVFFTRDRTNWYQDNSCDPTIYIAP